MEKQCTQCNQTKSLDHFYTRKNRKNGSSFCKNCFNKYCTTRWIEKKVEAIKYKGSVCLDCGTSYPNSPYVIFDFHHTNPAEKDVDWGKLRLRSWKKIKYELDKCVLLCSNCHRIRHHNMMHSQEDSNP